MKKKLEFNKFDFIIIAVVIFACISILTNSLFNSVGVSPDSVMYLKTARSILEGTGLHYNTAAGNSVDYLGMFPVGTSVLIALISFITSADVYISSVVLGICITILIAVIIRIHFPKRAWILILMMLNISYLEIFKYTWSERNFILGLLWLCLSCINIILDEEINPLSYISIGAACIFCFLSRYVGALSFGIVGLCSLYFLIRYFKNKNNNDLKKGIYLMITALICGIFMCGYLVNNHKITGYFTGMPRKNAIETFSDKTYNLTNSISIEFKNTVLMWSNEPVVNALFITFVFSLLISYKKVTKWFKETIKINDKKSNVSSLVFLAVGVVHFCALTILRYMKSFDMFSFRLLYPSSFLVFLALGIFIFNDGLLDKINKRISKKMCLVLSMFILIAMIQIYGVQYQGIGTYRQIFYKEMKEEMLEYYKDVPENSLVIGRGEMEQNIGYLRNDIVIGKYSVLYSGDSESLFNKYENVYVDTILLDEYIKYNADFEETQLLSEYINEDKGFVKIK